MADNFYINVVSIGRESLGMALDIALRSGFRSVVGYKINPTKGLVFYWSDAHDCIKLPFTLDLAGVTDFADRWLAEQDYGQEPDHDGHNKRGWQVYNEAWNRVGDEYSAFIAVRPMWIEYGK